MYLDRHFLLLSSKLINNPWKPVNIIICGHCHPLVETLKSFVRRNLLSHKRQIVSLLQRILLTLEGNNLLS